MSKESEILSAEVVLRSASGKEIAGDTAITAETIADFTPSSASIERATAAFRASGFTTSPAHGLGFSIEAPASVFRQFFRTNLEPDDRGSMQAIHQDGHRRLELPLDAVAPALQNVLVAVTFCQRPDFGPDDFSADY